jgi:hypothetical protein
VNGTVLFRPTEKDTFRVIARHDVQGHVRPAVLHLRRQALYASSNLGRDKTAIVLFDPETVKERECCSSIPRWTSTG